MIQNSCFSHFSLTQFPSISVCLLIWSNVLGCAVVTVCITVVVVIETGTIMLIPGAFSPLREGRSFSGTYNLFCIAFPFLGSQVFTALKLNSDKLLAPWLCRQCQYRKPAQTRLQKPSKAVSNLAYIHSLIFLGLVPYKMAMYVLASIFCES